MGRRRRTSLVPWAGRGFKSARTPSVESAQEARLIYARDTEPGFSRERRGTGFHYRDARGRRPDAKTMRRIQALVIPPAWTDVWIAAEPRAHLQATGRDARGRKQHRYHPRWCAVRDAAKYDRLRAFARALPLIRKRVATDLRAKALSRPWLLATIVRLLESSVIRIGNDEYRRSNGSYGLTTLLDRHVRVDGGRVTLKFRAKSGVMQTIHISDAVLASRVRRCLEIPGQTLFRYVDELGQPRAIGSGDVNAYLRACSGHDFTAKDFRTWAGTLAAARALDAAPEERSEAARSRQVLGALDQVAQRLGNTRAVCRKCYVHPVVLEKFLQGTTLSSVTTRRWSSQRGLDREEQALLAMLDAASASIAKVA